MLDTLRSMRPPEEWRVVTRREEEEHLRDVAEQLNTNMTQNHYVKRVITTEDPVKGTDVERLREKIKEDFASTVFNIHRTGPPPVRGPHGEATIELKPNATPAKQRMYQIHGPRGEAWGRMIDQLVAEGKLEDSVSAWSSPSFPVPKKKPGDYRFVVDYRRLNEATVTDGHPLPRIDDILQRQSRFRIWSVLDMKDGFHQVPLKKEHRHLTAMSTPRGTKQWTVLVMGLKNGGAIF